MAKLKTSLASINYTANFGQRKRLNNVKNILKLYMHIQAGHEIQDSNVCTDYSVKGQIVFKYVNTEIINGQSSWSLSKISIHCHFAVAGAWQSVLSACINSNQPSGV